MSGIDFLLRDAPDARGVESVEQFLGVLNESPYRDSICRAFWGGFHADRLGYAFVAGYTSALNQLVGPESTPRLIPRSFAVTERGGGHPRAIETQLVEEPDGSLRLRGEKTFASLATTAEEILIVAVRTPASIRSAAEDGTQRADAVCGRQSAEDGAQRADERADAERGRQSAEDGADERGEGRERKRLAVVRIQPKSGGLAIEERPTTPFAPEIPHAKLVLRDVLVEPEALLPGDGYARYVKPFRSMEDLHVLAAALGYVLREAHLNNFSRTVVEGAWALAHAVRSTSTMNITSPETHVALAGIFAQFRSLLDSHHPEWMKSPAATRERWDRDIDLLNVAEAVRQKRTEAAWRALGRA